MSKAPPDSYYPPLGPPSLLPTPTYPCRHCGAVDYRQAGTGRERWANHRRVFRIYQCQRCKGIERVEKQWEQA